MTSPLTSKKLNIPRVCGPLGGRTSRVAHRGNRTEVELDRTHAVKRHNLVASFWGMPMTGTKVNASLSYFGGWPCHHDTERAMSSSQSFFCRNETKEQWREFLWLFSQCSKIQHSFAMWPANVWRGGANVPWNHYVANQIRNLYILNPSPLVAESTWSGSRSSYFLSGVLEKCSGFNNERCCPQD